MIKLDMKIQQDWNDVDFRLNGNLVFYSHKRHSPYYRFVSIVHYNFNHDRMTKWESI